jgi:hypothetical protein
MMLKSFGCDRLAQSLVFGLLAMATFVLPASADQLPIILDPGGSVNPVPNFIDPNLQTSLPIVEDFFGNGSAPTGAFVAFVNTSSLNPFGSQDLVFSYDISVETGDVVQFSLAGFSGFETAVAQTTAGIVGVIPALDATLSSDANTLTFDFAGIPGGFTISSSLNVYTNALNYADPLATIVDVSGATAQFYTTGPSLPVSTAVPEPSSLSLGLSSALAGALFFVIRSTKTLKSTMAHKSYLIYTSYFV